MGADRGRGRGMVFKPAVLAAIPGEELRWLGKLGLGGIVDGEHFFILTRNADGSTHLTHGERYSGVLVALAKPFLNKERNQAGYEAFNQVLKQRVESVRAQDENRLSAAPRNPPRQDNRHRRIQRWHRRRGGSSAS